MPEIERLGEEEELVVKNIDINEETGKKHKSKKTIESKKKAEDTEDDEDDEDDDTEDEDDEDDEDDDDDDMVADGLTDVGLYNVLGSFLSDEEGATIGVSLSNIAKELNKLNHNLKKYMNK